MYKLKVVALELESHRRKYCEELLFPCGGITISPFRAPIAELRCPQPR